MDVTISNNLSSLNLRENAIFEDFAGLFTRNIYKTLLNMFESV